jgi:cytochrome c peroxidase
MIPVILMLLAFGIASRTGLRYPAHFPPPVYDFKKHSLSPEKIKLGRLLFYDPVLSSDGMVSCASCHNPYNAFAHTDHALSHGIHDSIGRRNAPALFNLAWQRELMWDGSVKHMDAQARVPITSPGEMGETMESVLRKLNAGSGYRELFRGAFGDSTANAAALMQALAQFELTLVSAGSRYDRVMQGKDSFTVQEQNGYRIFRQHCNTCHTEPLFSGYGYADNGLPVNTSLNDNGRAAVTGKKSDSLHFRIPSLRNLSYSYPYMHDGRFNTLRKVIRHYTEGVVQRPSLSAQLRRPIVLGDKEQVDLTTFLLSLNDTAFVFDSVHHPPAAVPGR